MDDILVAPGDRVQRDDTVVVLETGKVALDIPSPIDGRIIEIFVEPGFAVHEGQLVMTLAILD